MILAAGLGTRLQPLTQDLPKALIPVHGRPLILYTLNLLKTHGISDVIINLHYHGQKIKEALAENPIGGMKIVYSFEPEILGTGGGIKQVSHLLSDEPFVVINSDIIIDINIGQVVQFHKNQDALATMVLRDDPNVDAWGAVEMNSKNMVCRILNKPGPPNPEFVRRMFTGVHVMDPKALKYIPSGCFYNIMDAYLEMIQKGERILGYDMNTYWIDIGTPERYLRAQEELKKGLVQFNWVTGS